MKVETALSMYAYIFNSVPLVCPYRHLKVFRNEKCSLDAVGIRNEKCKSYCALRKYKLKIIGKKVTLKVLAAIRTSRIHQ